jgi:putative Mg2+ transporter-C (MgtC) family protein
MILGMLVGVEREINHKPAGIRTCALVCLGSALYTILSLSVTGSDPARIASNIVQGIGFLGAGSIITTRDKVIGLTTAAAIWVVAAIGMAVGFGKLLLALQTTILTVIIMVVIGVLERQFVAKVEKLSKARSIK